ncbi:hypothetical protein [Peterkaempfera griseoplana]|uniref:hypothetical protein n=1 Tax=Peterkaempfera griseoplana TaxID=66896 RepID=UPI0006E43A0F|nr:hypothetical protein [Peterkaempfera griseoplana]
MAALLVGGGAYALAGETVSPSEGATAGGSVAGGAGSGSGNGPGSDTENGKQAARPGAQQLWRIELPDSYQGMTRNDGIPGLAEMEEMAKAEYPSTEVVGTVYAGGEFGEKYAVVIGFHNAAALTEAERQEALANAWKADPRNSVHTVVGPVKDVDPGPLGGAMQCAQTVSEQDQPDVLGHTMFGSVQCVVVGVNTAIQFSESEDLSGNSISKTAADLRNFRAQAEVRR